VKIILGAVASILLATLLVAGVSAGETASLTIVAVDAAGAPIAGAVAELRSQTLSISLSTDTRGNVAFGVPLDAYNLTLKASGFQTYTTTINVQSAQPATIRVTLSPLEKAAVAPAATAPAATAPATTPAPTTPAPAPPPPPAPVPVGHAAPTAPPVRLIPTVPVTAPVYAAESGPPLPITQSLLALYNKKHPEHTKGSPYFGRYTYVLFSRDDTASARNGQVIASLIRHFVGFTPGTAIPLGAPQPDDNSYGYNLFLIPTSPDEEITHYHSESDATTGLIQNYDLAAADGIRGRYCRAAGHVSNKICSPTMSAGPLLLTTVTPLSAVGPGDFPPVLALDLTNVPPDRIENEILRLTVVIAVPGQSEKDAELPPSVADTIIYPALIALANSLQNSTSGVLGILDGFKSHVSLASHGGRTASAAAGIPPATAR